MIGRGDRHGVDVFAFQQLAKIGEQINRLLSLFEFIGLVLQHALVDVAQGHDMLAEGFEVVTALAVEADLGDADVVGAGGRQAASGDGRRGGAEGGLNELASMDCHECTP